MGSTFTSSQTNPGVYQYSVIDTSIYGCSSLPTNVDLYIYNIPEPTFTYYPGCAGTQPGNVFNYNINLGDASIDSVFWNWGDGQIDSLDVLGSSISHVYDPLLCSNGYSFDVDLLVLDANGCTNSYNNDSVEVFCNPIPSFQPNLKCEGDYSYFVNNANGISAPIDSIIWTVNTPNGVTQSFQNDTMERPTPHPKTHDVGMHHPKAVVQALLGMCG